MQVILASQSPRRRDLLNLIGIKHTVRPAHIDESPLPNEDPVACVERLARTKAERVAADAPSAMVIGADTIVVIDGRILNKPTDRDDAAQMLRALQGRVHVVYTAVCVTRGAEIASGVEAVEVTFRPLSDTETDAYIATGEPMDKAGAYGIQGYGATIVERIDGDFFAVMGLPLVLLTRLMRQVGVAYEFGHIAPATAQSSP
jgi:septum formation protein